MNENADTKTALLQAALELFAQNGYDGTSVRAVTKLADANLGAITYHFGSKDALYEATVEAVGRPIREIFAEVVAGGGDPLARIETLVRRMFGYLAENPQFPRILTQQLASSRRLPKAARLTMQKNINALATLIGEGQEDGSIRPGNPHLLALSIGSQPMWLSLARAALREGVAVDQDDPATQEQVVESVVRFVRAGLSTERVDES